MYSFDANYRASPKSAKRGEEKKKFLGAWKTLPNSDFNRVQFNTVKNESLLEIMHNSDLKHLEFEVFNNKFMLVSIL